MSLQVDAVYEHGVLKPLQPLDLAENERVVLNVTRTSETTSPPDPADSYIENLRKRLEGAPPALGLAEVRRIMAVIPGKLSDDVSADRGEY